MYKFVVPWYRVSESDGNESDAKLRRRKFSRALSKDPSKQLDRGISKEEVKDVKPVVDDKLIEEENTEVGSVCFLKI